MPNLLLKIRRAETPAYATVKRCAIALLRFHVPIPLKLKPLLRALYAFHWTFARARRRLWVLIYAEPLFRGRCDRVGERLFLWILPDIRGHAHIEIGDDVSISGNLGIASGRTNDHPRLIIGNKVTIGSNVGFVVNREIVVEEGARIASDCSIRDSDSHPLDHRYRIADAPAFASEIKPIRICRNAWVGAGSTVCKGVTIGEGAVIGAHSVVMTDIPPYARAVGNPARVLVNPGPPKTDFVVPPGVHSWKQTGAAVQYAS
jgi:acetyltransferase-like isoleucine patch superfamily enzyme